MERLQTLQLLSAGYEDAIEFAKPGIQLCNARGVHDASTAELAVGLAISVRRGFQDFMRAQDRQEWSSKRYNSLNDSNIGLKVKSVSISSKGLSVNFQGNDIQLGNLASSL